MWGQPASRVRIPLTPPPYENPSNIQRVFFISMQQEAVISRAQSGLRTATDSKRLIITNYPCDKLLVRPGLCKGSSEKPESGFELALKSWTLIKACSGTLCKPGSVCGRTRLFQFQTATLPVVVIHIVIYLFHQFVHRQFPCTIETLRLQHRKEAFHRRIVPTVRLTRHALNHGMLGKQFPISRRTVQHALVGMKHRSFAGQPGAAFSSISFTISLLALRLMV